MPLIERMLPVVVSIAFACATALGIVLAYHFSRFSPDRTVTIVTVGVYAAGVIVLMLLTSYALVHV